MKNYFIYDLIKSRKELRKTQNFKLNYPIVQTTTIL